AARRIQCQNNLKNLALGALNYAETNRGLPPVTGAVPDKGNNFSTVDLVEPYLSWMVRILPQIEQQPLADQFDLKLTIDQQNLAAAPQAQQVDIFLCPSEQARGRFYGSSRQFGGRMFA